MRCGRGWTDAESQPGIRSNGGWIGHILSPPGVTSLADYLEAVRRRVESPADGWPAHLELPQPPWGIIGLALRVARLYE